MFEIRQNDCYCHEQLILQTTNFANDRKYFISPQKYFRAHEQWGYCQAGTSAILLADKTALIGTPGPYTWRGTVFAVSTSDVSFIYNAK